MKEKFESRSITGSIKLALKDDEGNTIRTWVCDKEELCDHITDVVDAYQAQGYLLTLRQLYYQLVTKNYIPNHQTAYKKLSSIKDDLCYSGRLDWNAIEDRGRVPYLEYWVTGIQNALQDTIDAYKLDRQRGQKVCVELWSEKDAISGILKRVTDKYHIKLCINKGYTSSSAIYQAYERFAKYMNQGIKVIVLYFGDHDPSGLDMVRDIESRLKMMLSNGVKINYRTAYDFAEANRLHRTHQEEYMVLKDWQENGEKVWGFDNQACYVDHFFSVKHIGLTLEQIKQFKMVANPAKITDPRAKEYIKKFGRVSWEVDALDPPQLVAIVEHYVKQQVDIKKYRSVVKEENGQRNKLKTHLKKFFKK